jgi:hypothetical protein
VVGPEPSGDDSDQTWRQKAYDDIVAEIHKRQASGSENYDKSILSLASGGLGLSLAFLKDFVPINVAVQPRLLYWSWVAFTVAIISTIISFLTSNSGLERTKRKAYAYYLEHDDEAFDKSNWFDRMTHGANWLSGISFVGALVLSTAFLAVNLEGAAAMKQVGTKGSAPGKTETVQKGQPSPSLAKVPAPAAPDPKPTTSAPPVQAPASTDKK